MEFQIDYSELKSIKINKDLNFKFIELEKKYYIYLFFDSLTMYSIVFKEQNPDVSSDQYNFETNYKSISNFSPKKDNDGIEFSRLKLAPLGWTFCDHNFQFTTSKLNSAYSKDSTNSDFNFINIKYYKLVNNAEVEIIGEDLNQIFLDSNCIMTSISWEPTFDYDIRSGKIRRYGTIDQNVHLWVVAVPDVPYAYGGSREMLTGGTNLKFRAEMDVDGGVVKHLVYNPTYHTNKLKLIARHPVGFQSEMECGMSIYKE